MLVLVAVGFTAVRWKHGRNVYCPSWCGPSFPSVSHLWLDDSKKVPANDELLGEAVVFMRMEGDAEEAHDAGVVGQV